MEVQLAKDYKPHPHQRRLHNSRKRFVLAAAGVRGGKTLAAVAELLFRIYRDYASGKGRKVFGKGRYRSPALRYWIVSPTVQLGREPMRYVERLCDPALIEQVYENAIWLRPNILIESRSADNPQSLVAAGLDGLLVDEAARVKQDAWLGQLRQRLSDHNGWAIFATTPLGRNWVYEYLVRQSETDAQYETVQWTTADNPQIPAEEIEAARRQLPAAYFTREYLASFDAFSGLVFNEFQDELHVTSEAEFRDRYNVQSGRPIHSVCRRVVAGVDWGWTGPGAMVVVGDLGNGHYVVLDESYASTRLVSDARLDDTWVDQAHKFRSQYNVTMFLCDPESQQNINEFQRFGVPAENAINDVQWGLRKINEALHPINGKPRLVILDRCQNLIREMRKYVWDMKRNAADFAEVPAPNQNDHAIDAMRYGCVEFMQFEQVKEMPHTQSSATMRARIRRVR